MYQESIFKRALTHASIWCQISRSLAVSILMSTILLYKLCEIPSAEDCWKGSTFSFKSLQTIPWKWLQEHGYYCAFNNNMHRVEINVWYIIEKNVQMFLLFWPFLNEVQLKLTDGRTSQTLNLVFRQLSRIPGKRGINFAKNESRLI